MSNTLLHIYIYKNIILISEITCNWLHMPNFIVIAEASVRSRSHASIDVYCVDLPWVQTTSTVSKSKIVFSNPFIKSLDLLVCSYGLQWRRKMMVKSLWENSWTFGEKQWLHLCLISIPKTRMSMCTTTTTTTTITPFKKILHDMVQVFDSEIKWWNTHKTTR